MLNAELMRDVCGEIVESSLALSFSRKKILIPGSLNRSNTVNGQKSLFPLGIMRRYNSVNNQMYPMFSIWVLYIYNWCMIVSTNDINGLDRSQSLLLTMGAKVKGMSHVPEDMFETYGIPFKKISKRISWSTTHGTRHSPKE